MTSREKILKAVKRNQPEHLPLPADLQSVITYADHVNQFRQTLSNIGGVVVPVQSLDEISRYIGENFKEGHHLVSTVSGIAYVVLPDISVDPHEFETVELAVMQGSIAVAENGAVWLAEDQLNIRVLPFICQHLAVIVSEKDIVHNMHEAYAKIGSSDYGFGVFIAGPSKTADIEQSLVLGAHGPRGMTVFLMS